MEFKQLSKVHIIGIGGCASSAIAQYLTKNGITVTGSEFKQRNDLGYLEESGIKVVYNHQIENLNINDTYPDLVLFSPAVQALDPDNCELKEAKRAGVSMMSWQQFIGNYLNSIGKTGITVSGSEGKGTTAGILTTILKNTKYDPLSILGAKLKSENGASNIHIGNGLTYILEGDEFNCNFYHYHPAINVMVNFKYEHPETYSNFEDYKNAFHHFFKGMTGQKVLILKATSDTVQFVNQFKVKETHKIIWYGDGVSFKNMQRGKLDYIIQNININTEGIQFFLESDQQQIEFRIPILPGFMVVNAAGAIIAAIELGLPITDIQQNILQFKGMQRRFDLFRTKQNGIIITDYGHSPESISHIIKEIKKIFKERRVHLIFQPHLYSRTYNFFTDFIKALNAADKVTLVDIYPARENPTDWQSKISSEMLVNELKKNTRLDCFYIGPSKDIKKCLEYISENEVTCFIGAGDMDFYYPEILTHFQCQPYFN